VKEIRRNQFLVPFLTFSSIPKALSDRFISKSNWESLEDHSVVYLLGNMGQGDEDMERL
jgi:hypothetical protein